MLRWPLPTTGVFPKCCRRLLLKNVVDASDGGENGAIAAVVDSTFSYTRSKKEVAPLPLLTQMVARPELPRDRARAVPRGSRTLSPALGRELEWVGMVRRTFGGAFEVPLYCYCFLNLFLFLPSSPVARLRVSKRQRQAHPLSVSDRIAPPPGVCAESALCAALRRGPHEAYCERHFAAFRSGTHAYTNPRVASKDRPFVREIVAVTPWVAPHSEESVKDARTSDLPVSCGVDNTFRKT